ncbi:MAG TPA: extracellular solute-binding protein, partial [Acetobacteraceae bacterium]
MAASVTALAGPARAACSVPEPAAASEVALLANSIPVVQFLANQMKGCANPHLQVNARLTPDITTQSRIVLAAGGNSPYAVVQVSNSSFSEFVAKGYLQPITDLVRKYWDTYKFDDIPESLWKQVSYRGEIYAIPFMTNVELLFYRRDLLEKYGIKPPATYAEYLAAAETLKAREPGLDAPVAETLGGGWHLATRWGNIYQALGGTWFDRDGKPTFNDETGIRATELLKSLMPFRSPNALSFSNDDTMVAFQQGRAALGVVWATRAANMDAAEISRV